MGAIQSFDYCSESKLANKRWDVNFAEIIV